MSLDQPSGVYDVHDTEFCGRCDGLREGEWVAREGSNWPAFLCATCGWVTANGADL